MPYIYKIENKINGKVYIGKTSRTVEERWNEHVNDRKRRKFENRPQYRALNKYGIDSFCVDTLEEVETDEAACERECYWIAYYDSFGKNGYNATQGGDGKSWVDRDIVIDSYERVSSLKELSQLVGVSACHASSIQKQAGVHVKSGQEIQAEKCSKAVEMYTKDGEYLRSFNSSYDAGRYLVDNQLTGSSTKVVRYHISEVCRGKRKSAAGYKWKYKYEQ